MQHRRDAGAFASRFDGGLGTPAKILKTKV
jgi:hypothetical protein